MNQKQIVSPGQLLTMIMLFEFGTALVIPIGLKAEQSTWLSILIALPGGVLLYLMYVRLLGQFPNVPLSGCIRNILGRYMEYPICMLYIAVFLYISARNLREAGDLLVTSAYDRTPIFVIHFVMITAVIYVLSKGIEVFFRLGQIYFIITLSLGVIGNLAVLSSGIVDLKNLLPLQGESWASTLEAAYPHIWMFPFAEVIAFTAVLPRLNKFSLAKKSGVIALVLAGMLLSLTHAMQVAVLGKEIYSRATFPLFSSISMVNIGDFLQRLDAIVVLTLIIGVFFKMSVYCYAAMVITAGLFHIPDERRLALPAGIVVLHGSILSAMSFPDHADEGRISVVILFPILYVIVPTLLLAVHSIRKRFGLYR